MNIKKIVKYITIAALFLIPVFPLIVTNSLYFPFITGKAFYFRILVEVAFAGWVVLAFLDAKYRPKLTGLTLAVSVFTLIALVADLFGVEPMRSLWSNLERMEGWMTIIHLWAMYLVFTCVFGPDEEGRKLWRRWLNFSIAVALIVAVYGLFQFFGWADFHQNPGRLDASFGNAEFLAVYMLINAFIAAYLFITSRIKAIVVKKSVKRSRTRWIYPALVILFSFVVVGTQTRGAILGLVAGVLLSLFLFAFFKKSESKRLRLIAICVFCLVLAGGAIFWFNRNTAFVRSNSLLSRFASISLSDASNQSRLYIWPMALKGAMGRPILGWGQENFTYVFQAHYNPAMHDQELWFDRAHNVFLDWLVNSGIIGLLSYVSLYVLFLLYVWKSDVGIAEKSVFTGLLAAYAFNNMFVFDNLGSYVLFFALLGYSNTLRPNGWNIFSGKPARADAVQYILAPIALVSLFVVIYFVNVRPIRASAYLTTATDSCLILRPDATSFQSAFDVNSYMANEEALEQLFACMPYIAYDPSVDNNTKQASIKLAEDSAKIQISLAPDDSRNQFLYGTFGDVIGQAEEARPYLLKAHALSPARQLFDFELAANYLDQKDTGQALDILKQAYLSAPEYGKAALAYAVALTMAGRYDEAQRLVPDKTAILDAVKSYVSDGNDYAKAMVVFQGVIADSGDAQALVLQARREYSAGMVDKAVQTLQSIETTDPALKENVENAITQIRQSKKQNP